MSDKYMLICGRCGRDEACSDDDADRYLRTGWPACCGFTMKLVQRSAQPVGHPISDLVNLARRYSAEEWQHASSIAANQYVAEACDTLARLRRSNTP